MKITFLVLTYTCLDHTTYTKMTQTNWRIRREPAKQPVLDACA